jgi:hypothetical protein
MFLPGYYTILDVQASTTPPFLFKLLSLLTFLLYLIIRFI